MFKSGSDILADPSLCRQEWQGADLALCWAAWAVWGSFGPSLAPGLPLLFHKSASARTAHPPWPWSCSLGGCGVPEPAVGSVWGQAELRLEADRLETELRLEADRLAAAAPQFPGWQSALGAGFWGVASLRYPLPGFSRLLGPVRLYKGWSLSQPEVNWCAGWRSTGSSSVPCSFGWGWEMSWPALPVLLPQPAQLSVVPETLHSADFLVLMVHTHHKSALAGAGVSLSYLARACPKPCSARAALRDADSCVRASARPSARQRLLLCASWHILMALLGVGWETLVAHRWDQRFHTDVHCQQSWEERLSVCLSVTPECAPPRVLCMVASSQGECRGCVSEMTRLHPGAAGW